MYICRNVCNKIQLRLLDRSSVGHKKEPSDKQEEVYKQGNLICKIFITEKNKK